MNDLVKKDPAGAVDNFAGWDDGVEGDDRPENSGLIQGTLIKFTAEGLWVDREGNEIPGDLELVAADVIRLVQKWQDRKPVETIVLQPHQKFPNVEAMNDAVPRDEWEEGPAGLHGPWQSQHLLYLVNLETMDKYSFPSSTVGGRIAIRDLRERIVWMRRLKGSDVYPVVTLSRSWMNTKYGGRWRPAFNIKPNWVRLGGGEAEALPPSPATSPTPIAASVQQVAPQSDLPKVSEPSLKEEMNDEIPNFDEPVSPPKQTASKPAPNLKTTARRELKKNPQKPAAKPAGKKGTILDAG
jgi:hypothetical protein